MTEPLAYSTRELRQAIPALSRHAAQRLMRELGVNVSPRRRVLPRVRLEQWLKGGDAMTHADRGQEDGRPGPKAETAV